MANIGRRPTASQLVLDGVPRGSYGDHLFFLVDSNLAMLIDADDRVLARGNAETLEVFLEVLDMKTVPYVNAFIDDPRFNLRVEKNWRSGKYRLGAKDKNKPTHTGTETVEEIDILAGLTLEAPPDRETLKRAIREAALHYRGLVALENKLYGDVDAPTAAPTNRAAIAS